jgi:hypothetical protein
MRGKDITRKVEVPLKELEGRIPRSKDGDPAFQFLRIDPLDRKGLEEGGTNMNTTAVLDVFTPEQVVALVNRALYQMEYSRESHRVRSQKLRDQEKPVKEAFKRLYPTTSWVNATEEQITNAVKEAFKDGR